MNSNSFLNLTPMMLLIFVVSVIVAVFVAHCLPKRSAGDYIRKDDDYQ